MEPTRVGDYCLFHSVGEGQFGKVRLGRNQTTGEHVAVKVIEKNLLERCDLTDQVRKEVAIMKILNHRHIVKLHQVLSSDSRFYIVMDYVAGGELFRQLDTIGNHGEVVARRYMQQLIDGVDYCHRQGVTHRDLKPENLLVDTGDILKITDFGFSTMKSKNEEGQMLFTQCGTPDYCAPEVIRGHPSGYSGVKADTWSCGVILYAMLTGTLPFHGETDNDLLDSIFACKVHYPPSMSPGARGLLQKILVLDPKARYDIAQVKQNLWFTVGYSVERDRIRMRLGEQPRESPIGAHTEIPTGLSDRPNIPFHIPNEEKMAHMVATALTETESSDFLERPNIHTDDHQPVENDQNEGSSVNQSPATTIRSSSSGDRFFSGRLSQLPSVRLDMNMISMSKAVGGKGSTSGFGLPPIRLKGWVRPEFNPPLSSQVDVSSHNRDTRVSDRNITVTHAAMTKVFKSNMTEQEFRERVAVLADLTQNPSMEKQKRNISFKRRGQANDDAPPQATTSFDDELAINLDERRAKVKGPRIASDMLPISSKRTDSFSNPIALIGSGEPYSGVSARRPFDSGLRSASETTGAPGPLGRSVMSEERSFSLMENENARRPSTIGVDMGRPSTYEDYAPNIQRRQVGLRRRMRLPTIRANPTPNETLAFQTRLPPDQTVDILGTLLMAMGGSVTMKRDTGQKLRCDITLGNGHTVVLSVVVSSIPPTSVPARRGGQVPGATKVLLRLSKQDKRKTTNHEFQLVFDDLRSRFNDELRDRVANIPTR